jgi:hypothetical protein
VPVLVHHLKIKNLKSIHTMETCLGYRTHKSAFWCRGTTKQFKHTEIISWI